MRAAQLVQRFIRSMKAGDFRRRSSSCSISVGILCAIDLNSVARFIHALIDRGDFIDPATALRMIEIQHRFRLPVEVIGDEGYLLVQLLEGVA